MGRHFQSVMDNISWKKKKKSKEFLILSKNNDKSVQALLFISLIPMLTRSELRRGNYDGGWKALWRPSIPSSLLAIRNRKAHVFEPLPAFSLPYLSTSLFVQIGTCAIGKEICPRDFFPTFWNEEDHSSDRPFSHLPNSFRDFLVIWIENCIGDKKNHEYFISIYT